MSCKRADRGLDGAGGDGSRGSVINPRGINHTSPQLVNVLSASYSFPLHLHKLRLGTRKNKLYCDRSIWTGYIIIIIIKSSVWVVTQRAYRSSDKGHSDSFTLSNRTWHVPNVSVSEGTLGCEWNGTKHLSRRLWGRFTVGPSNVLLPTHELASYRALSSIRTFHPFFPTQSANRILLNIFIVIWINNNTNNIKIWKWHTHKSTIRVRAA